MVHFVRRAGHTGNETEHTWQGRAGRKDGGKGEEGIKEEESEDGNKKWKMEWKGRKRG